MRAARVLAAKPAFLSPRAQLREPSPIRALLPLMQQPGMLSLAGGLPNPELFPIRGLSLTLRNGTTIEVPEEDVKTALQYSPSPGIPAFVSAVRNHMATHLATPPRAGDETVVGTGSQDLLEKALDALLAPGQPLILESPSYAGMLAALRPIAPKFSPVASSRDGSGMDLGGLAAALAATPAGQRPVVVVVPTGANPTGATMPAAKRAEFCRLCAAHRAIVLEDDPYASLVLGGATPPPTLYAMAGEAKYAGMSVVRFDSMSKVLSAGLRLGWVTGPKEIVDAVQLAMQCGAMHTSGVAQMVALSTLRALGPDGVAAHIRGVQAAYTKQRDLAVGAARRHLAGLAEFEPPTAGMFLWMRLLGVADTESLVRNRASAAKVLLLPGSAFLPGGGVSQYVRASFSLATAEQFDTALSRLAALVKDEQKQKSA